MPARRAPALCDPAAFFAPPYEDVVTEGFVWNLVKYLAPAFDLTVRALEGGTLVTVKALTAKAPSTHGRASARSVTFAFAKRREPDSDTDHGSDAGRGQGVEVTDIEREEEKEANASRAFTDEIAGHVPPGALYLLRTEDVVHRLQDVLAVVSQWDAALFSERGRLNLSRLASSEARSTRVTPACSRVIVSYPDARSATSLVLDAEVAIPETLIIHREMRARPSTPEAHTTPPAGPSAQTRTGGQRKRGFAACG